MNSKERIINAAIEVFAKKGKHGARMEEIAAKAKVNKAMVYYYYNSKENLFREVLNIIMSRIFESVSLSLNQLNISSDNVAEKVRQVVRAHFEALSQNSNFVKIFIETVAKDPDELYKAIETAQISSKIVEKLLAIFTDGISKKIFRNIDPKQILISILGLNIMYFIGKPIFKKLLNISVENEQKFIKDRENVIVDLLLYGIMQRRNLK